MVLVNDNGRSYTPTVGGLAKHLTGLRTNPRYEQVLDVVKRRVSRAPFGATAYDLLHGIKSGLKDVLAPQGLFADLGLKYVGPVDGHDVAAVERALTHAKQFGGPVLVHCLTRKGNGFKAAEDHEEDRFHAVGRIDAVTGQSLGAGKGLTWTDVFAEELVRLGARDERIVAITAAMTYPTGLFSRYHQSPRPMSPRSLLAAALLAAPALSPAAQAQTTFGLKAGLNVSDFTGDDAPSNTDPRLGFSGGVFATVPVGQSGLYVQPEALYSMKGVDGGGNSNTTLAVDYVEIPLLLGYAVPVTQSGLTLGAYAGPALGIKVRENLNGGFGSANTDAFKSTDVGAALGATLGAGPFAIDGRYTLGLTNALDVNNGDLRNGAFTIGAAYRFGGTQGARRPRRRGSRY